MALDPSLINSGQQSLSDLAKSVADIGPNIARAQILNTQAKSQQQDLADQQAIRSAYANSMVKDANGNATLDQGRVLSNLSSNPQTAYLVPKVSAEMAQNQMQLQKMKVDQAMAHVKVAAQFLGNAKSQKDYDAGVQQMKAIGLPVDQFQGKPWSPQLSQQIVDESQDAQTKLENHFKEVAAGAEALKAKAAAAEAGIPVGGVTGAGPSNGGKAAASGTSGSGLPGGANGQPTDDPSPIVGQRVPLKLRAKAYEDVKDAQNITSIAQKSLDAFDLAAKEVRPMTGGLTGTSGTALVPFMESPNQKVWQGLANTTVKGVEGTARQAAFDSLKKNFMPQFGDSDETIAEKRAGYINYLKSHLASPTNKSYGIDLTKFSSTSLPDGFGQSKTQAPAPPEGATREYNGATYKVVGHQWVKQSSKQAAR